MNLVCSDSFLHWAQPGGWLFIKRRCQELGRNIGDNWSFCLQSCRSHPDYRIKRTFLVRVLPLQLWKKGGGNAYKKDFYLVRNAGLLGCPGGIGCDLDFEWEWIEKASMYPWREKWLIVCRLLLQECWAYAGQFWKSAYVTTLGGAARVSFPTSSPGTVTDTTGPSVWSCYV